MFSNWKKKSSIKQKVQILSPLSGKAVALAQVPDEAFAGGLMGPGLAIIPDEGRLVAPFAGTISHVIKSKHAVIVEHPLGLQFLFHIGVNTVSLKGNGFTAHVETGQQIQAGQLLIEFDMELIHNSGYPVITPVILTNADDMTDNMDWLLGPVTAGESIILAAELKD